MRIALVILHADPARGGAERYTVDLAAALAARGHEVELLATSAAEEEAGRGVPVRTLAVRAVTRVGRYRAFLDALDEHLARTPYDLVHAMLPVRACDLYHPHAGLAAEAVESGHLKHAGLFRRRLSRVANRLNVKRQRFAGVERELLTGERPPVVLCLSEYVKQTVRKQYPGLDEGRLATLFNAVDLGRFDPRRVPEAGQQARQRYGIGKGMVVALMIAQDFERKGLREAIEAVARLGDRRVALLVVGKEPTERYAALARRLGVAEQVVFAGPTRDPYPFYAAADLFVLPTRHDPCSLVVLEALAMGVPVISTVFNGACEIMRQGEHGFVMRDPGDVGALAEAMGRLAGDAAFLARCAAACLALRPALSYEGHVERLVGMYQSVMDGTGIL